MDPALALFGKRVRVWYKSERKWKVGTVRSVTSGPDVPDLFQVACGGKANPHYYRADELQPLKGSRLARSR